MINEIILEPSHPMASSNTGDSRVFRNTVGNYISRKAYLEMLSTSKGCVSHKYLSPNESAWLMSVR
jgi:predicted helicase